MVPFMIVKDRLIDRPTTDIKKIPLACNHVSFLLDGGGRGRPGAGGELLKTEA